MVFKVLFGMSLKKVWSLLFALQLVIFLILKCAEPQYSGFLLSMITQLDNMIRMKVIPTEELLKNYMPSKEIAK